MRRDAKAVIASHLLDPDRKEVFVEGHGDRILLNWICGPDRNPNARVLQASSLYLPDVPRGGERSRLLEFARLVVDSSARILLFIDADTDRLENVTPPPNVILTDGRDIESYILTPPCLDKVVRLGLGAESVEVNALHAQLMSVAATAGAIRMASDVEALALPFQRTDIRRYIRVADDSTVEFDTSAYVQTLLQNASVSLSERERITARAQAIRERYGDAADLIHGKDAMRLLDVLLKEFGAKSDEARKMLWCSFERTSANVYPNLLRVVSFLTSP